ncbi:cold shock domain-containing protein [Rhodococcus sp. SGAir0479]|nr:cold shock domain-containing protein [Rhodococcus sp. SGAir0479]QCQ91173.1 cold shock domain-containing protein [Rhodococcus sp. SGAir0479]
MRPRTRLAALLLPLLVTSCSSHIETAQSTHSVGAVTEFPRSDVAGAISATGTVREWHTEDGWGVIDSTSTPGGCWVSFSAVVGTGFRTLTVGRTVDFEWEHVTDQDGYRYRATRAEHA